MNLVSLLEKRAEEHPDKIFLYTEGRNYTFKELREEASRVAGFLKRKGLRKGERVAILSLNSPRFVFAFFGVMFAGGIPVPLNYLLERELEGILQDLSPSFLLLGEDFYPKKRELEGGWETISMEDIEGESIPASFPYEIAVILYTSGTTGKPRGVILTQENLISDIRGCLERIRVYPEDRFAILLPLFHSFSLTTTLLTPLYAGCSTVLLPDIRYMDRILENLFRFRVSIFIAIPYIYQLLLKAELDSLPFRFCVSGGERLLPRVEEEFEDKFRIPLIQGYGLTETSPVVSLNPLEKEKRGSVGLPIPGVELRIMGKEEGEIAVRGPVVMKEYWRNPQETERVFHEGWFLTGDIGRLDEEGYLYILERKKEMIIVKGLNVYPSEVEAVIREIPGVKECAVVGVEKGGKEIGVAFVVMEGERSENKIHTYLRQRIAPYKIPRRIIFQEELPRLPTGKVNKRLLQASYGKG